MLPTILAAIIGALIGISPKLIKLITEYKSWPQVSKDRIKALKGTWKGEVQEMDDKGKLLDKYPIVLYIKPRGHKLSASAELFTERQKSIIKGNGRIFTDKYFFFYYSNANEKIIHYGSSIVELSDDAKEIKGKAVYCGFDTHESLFCSYTARKHSDEIETA